jgi:hypothetical protein
MCEIILPPSSLPIIENKKKCLFSGGGGGGSTGGPYGGGQCLPSQDEGPSSFEPPDVFCALGSLIVEGRLPRAGGGRGCAEGPHVELPGRISRHKCSAHQYLVSLQALFTTYSWYYHRKKLCYGSGSASK